MRARPVIVKLHRYAGLTLAIFLIIAGVTGSIIAWSDELDRMLNPELFTATARGDALPPSELAAWVQKQLPGATVTLMPLSLPVGQAAVLRVAPDTLAYDQVFADPVTGKVIGTRKWGEFALTRAAIIPFIYLAHYSLQIPEDTGVVIMGIAACVWVFDCFFGFMLTLPRGAPFWKKWGTSWRVKRGAGNYRLNLDLHRAGGLWLWLVLLMMAVSGVALNLNDSVFRPVLSTFAILSPSPLEIAASLPPFHPKDATVGWNGAVEAAGREAARRGWVFTPRNVFYYSLVGAYGVGFSRGGEDGRNGMGNSYVYVSARDGHVLAREFMGSGTPGDVFAQAQYALHSGRILGLTGRILISLLGLAVAGLSGTGIYIWARKRRHKVWAPKRKPALEPLALRLDPAE